MRLKSWWVTGLGTLTMILVFGIFHYTQIAEGRPKANIRLPNAAGDYRTNKILNDANLQALGEKIFFDKTLSSPSGMSCAACHDSHAGWSGPDSAVNQASNIYPGAISTRFGNRKPNSVAYATYAPILHTRSEGGDILFVGGNFWDGRATGCLLGNPAADQAQQPFLDKVEHNLKDAADVVKLVEISHYAGEFGRICDFMGLDKKLDEQSQIQLKFGYIGLALAAFENSSKVNAFTSKYDAFLRGEVQLTAQEKRGLKIFEEKGKCAECHPNKLSNKRELPLFTDFTYDNLGIPANPDNPWYRMDKSINPSGTEWIDEGLGGFLKTQPQYASLARANLGRHRVPTLRNVDKRPDARFARRYGHNGYFRDLQSVIHFYNTRDVQPFNKAVGGLDARGKWPKPEVQENVNRDEMGDLKLTRQEEDDLLVFLRTLNDGYKVK
ncbi:MAG TPA: cytochrome c peroxidase [Smithella sp.]|nr:cytochrome c peroxidase [Smithella sp.]